MKILTRDQRYEWVSKNCNNVKERVRFKKQKKSISENFLNTYQVLEPATAIAETTAESAKSTKTTAPETKEKASLNFAKNV